MKLAVSLSPCKINNSCITFCIEVEVKEMQLEVLERSVTEQMAKELKNQKQMLAYHLQEIKQLEEEIQLLFILQGESKTAIIPVI